MTKGSVYSLLRKEKLSMKRYILWTLKFTVFFVFVSHLLFFDFLLMTHLLRFVCCFRKMLLARDCALGMNWLHKQGILHLDLKPANILVSSHRFLHLLTLSFELSQLFYLCCFVSLTLVFLRWMTIGSQKSLILDWVNSKAKSQVSVALQIIWYILISVLSWEFEFNWLWMW